MCFVAKFHKICTSRFFCQRLPGSDFETSRIAQTGSEKGSSIAVRAYLDNNYAFKIKVH